MFTDYKWWYVRRDDDGFIIEAAVRFFEGEVRWVPDSFSGGQVQRYVRTGRLGRNDVGLKAHIPRGRFQQDRDANDLVIYTPADFGAIKTDDELRAFCDGELAKDPTRTPIAEQRNG